MSKGTKVAFVTPNWFRRDEIGFVQSCLASALAGICDLHIVTLEGRKQGVNSYGGVTLHDLGPQPADPARDLMRMAIHASFEEASFGEPMPGSALAYLKIRTTPRWSLCSEVFAEIQPQVVMLVSTTDLEGLAASAKTSATRTICAPLFDTGQNPPSLDAGRMLSKIDTVLTVTDADHSALRLVLQNEPKSGTKAIAAKVIQSGMLMPPPFLPTDPSICFELPQSQNRRPYVLLVISDPYPGPAPHEHAVLNGPGVYAAAQTAQAVTAGISHIPLVIVAGNHVTTWLGGAVQTGLELVSGSHLDAIIATSLACVDLCPGPVVGRITLTALSLGTPVLAPISTAAAKAVRDSKGGVVYGSELELENLIKALDEFGFGYQRQLLGEAGKSWVAANFAQHSQVTSKLASAIEVRPTQTMR